VPQALRLGVERVRDEPANIAEPEERQRDLMHTRTSLADSFRRAPERVARKASDANATTSFYGC
jgi:hypothetical protein